MVNKILCEIVPIKEVPGLLPNKKKLRKPATMELSKRNILYTMRYAKVYAIIDDIKILISGSERLDEVMSIANKEPKDVIFKLEEKVIPKYEPISKDEMPDPVKVETPSIDLKIEEKYVEDIIEDEKETEEVVNEETSDKDVEEYKKEEEKPSFNKDRFVKASNNKKPPLKKETDKK